MNLQATLPNQKYQNFNKEALFAIYFYIFLTLTCCHILLQLLSHAEKIV